MPILDKSNTQYVLCGCCETYHREDYYGDCRDDEERFDPDQLDEFYGPTGWSDVTESEEEIDAVLYNS